MDLIEFRKGYEHKKVIENPNSVTLNPIVSVCVQTYQHVNFIGDCLDSILIQKTDFEFEILLGEDESTDGTREICINYAERYPEKIRLFLHHRENNMSIGGSPTGRFIFLNNLFKAQGKYIALCEGDDYWCDPYKLQKQVDILENNSDYSACFTNAEIKEEDSGKNTSYLDFTRNRVFKLDEIILIGGGLFPTASLLFRNNISNWPEFIFNSRSGDRALSLILGEKGDFYYLKDKTCVYRQHNGGIFSRNIDNRLQRTKIHLSNIDLLKEFDNWTNGRNKKVVKKAISKLSKKALLLKKRNTDKKSIGLLKNLNVKDFLSFFKNSVFK